MAHAGGRPTKYSKHIETAARKYLSECRDEDVQLLKQANTEKGYEMYHYKVKVKLPTIEGLAVYLKVNRDTLYEWAKAHSQLSDILEELKEKQAERLINSGLSGEYNPTITKLLLAKHGYVEKTEHSGKDGGPIEQRIIYLPQRHEPMEGTSGTSKPSVVVNA